jgi:hypothetical protein
LDFVGFFGIDGGEFSWMVLTPILVKYAWFCFVFFNDFLDWRITSMLNLIWFGTKRCNLLGLNFECFF